MKKNLSILGLCIKGTWLKIIVSLISMMGIEIGVFYYKLQSFAGSPPLFEEVLKSILFPLLFGLGFIFSVLQLDLFLTAKNNLQSAYTLTRLSIKETTMYAEFAVFSLFVTIAVWAAQIAAAVFMGMMYEAANTAAPYGPVLFLGFYRNPFLHRILPLGDIIGWVTVILSWIAVSTSIAAGIKKQFYTRKPYAGESIVCSLLVLFMVRTTEETNYIYAMSIVCFTIFTLMNFYQLSDNTFWRSCDKMSSEDPMTGADTK